MATWEKQERESDPAFEAFKTYLKMPENGEERSLRQTAKKLKKSLTLVGRWSSQWNWKNRCRDYDNDIMRREAAATRKRIRDTADRQAKIAAAMQKKALDALNIIEPEELSAADISRMFATGADIEARNLQSMLGEGGETIRGEIEIYIPDNGRK